MKRVAGSVFSFFLKGFEGFLPREGGMIRGSYCCCYWCWTVRCMLMIRGNKSHECDERQGDSFHFAGQHCVLLISYQETI
jgi:hypothetical protein